MYQSFSKDMDQLEILFNNDIKKMKDDFFIA